MNEIIDFLIKAKKNTYANGNALRGESSRLGSKDYHYEEVLNKKKAHLPWHIFWWRKIYRMWGCIHWR